MTEAAYLALHRSGQLAERATAAQQQLSACTLCGWDCAIDRSNEIGPCQTGTTARVSTSYIHFGEEAPLVGKRGSGAIFFANCDLRCLFCQTWRWNVKGQGQDITPAQLAYLMLDLQAKNAHNINLVTPTHVLPQILAALVIAADEGLTLPLVWNSGGYDSPAALALLEGIVDIYLPDMKYADADLARKLSGIRDYPQVNRAAVLEMQRQVGPLKLDGNGVATRGLLVRHLVMPGQAENTRAVLRWLADELGPNTYFSLMDQYRPAYRAEKIPGIDAPITPDEYGAARSLAESLGLTRLDAGRTLEISPKVD